MATHGRDGAARDETSKVGRRGILAAAAMAVAGLAARHVADAQPVAASNTDTNFIATGNVTNFDAQGTAAIGVSTINGTFSTGVVGKGSTGVQGFGTTYGVFATGNVGIQGTGVVGVFGTGGTGVSGFGNGNGTYGVRANTTGTGTYGTLATTSGAGSIALGGYAYGPGSFGVYGTSATSHGVYGITAAPGQSSVYGYATASGAAAINGVAGSAAYAGAFTGAVVVNGDFVAFGGVKSAAVPHADGSHRLVYCVESPESWLEDFGEGKLVGGRAEVKLDADFAAVADTGKMHVFVTSDNEEHHLAVKAKGANSFTVAAGVSGESAARGKKASDANGTFSYRIVAKRKDIEGRRLAKFTLPKVDTAAPKVPEPPQRPDGR